VTKPAQSTEGGFSLRKYETAIVWSTSLSEKELEKELKLVQETISAEKGTYLKTDSWGRRQLAYPIKKQTEGVYFFLRWDGEERVKRPPLHQKSKRNYPFPPLKKRLQHPLKKKW